MTPGNHPIMVKIMLISKVVPTPCFKNTANGGKKMFNKIVSMDIIESFKELECLMACKFQKEQDKEERNQIKY